MVIDWTQVSAFAAVFAAIVTGLFLLLRGYLDRKSARLQAGIASDNAKLQAKLSSEVKLAEFRQQWINELRNDMARYQAIGLRMHHDKSNLFEFVEVENRIRLRVNPGDENYPELLDAMNGIRHSKKADEAFVVMDRFIACCQVVLKLEWNKLRDDLRNLKVPQIDQND